MLVISSRPTAIFYQKVVYKTHVVLFIHDTKINENAEMHNEINEKLRITLCVIW